MGTKTEVLLADETPISEIDELRQLITDGQERGFLTFAQIASSLEEIEVTKEQVAELHAYLVDQGIEVVGDDGRPAVPDGGRFERVAEAAEKTGETPRKAEIDLTVEPSLDSLRLYLRSIGRVALLTAEREVIEMRFGLTGARPYTLEEVGRAFNVTRERIRQIENHTLKKLESLPEAQRLRDAG